MANLWTVLTRRWQHSANLVLGIWLFVSPWILQFMVNELGMWNAFVLGVAA